MRSEYERALFFMNPWLAEPALKQERISTYLAKPWIERTADTSAWEIRDRIHLVVGPRQAGKTSLVWHYLSTNDSDCLYFNAEDPLVQAWCRSPALFLDDIANFINPGGTLFFDEVQHLEEAGLFLKGLVDYRKGYRYIATGSASYHLHARTRESLAGRATRFTLYPLSLKELSLQYANLRPGVAAKKQQEIINRMLLIGSFPGVWSAKEPQTVLGWLLDAFIMRDASDLFNISRHDAFRRLISLIAGQIGQLVNFSEWASICGISSPTVAQYVSILEDAHVISLLPAYAGGKRKEITSRKKAYFLDNGLRNTVFGGFQPFVERADKGPLLENWVYTEIRKAFRPLGPETVYYWRSSAKAEVDFVLSGRNRLEGIEVKASALGYPSLSRSSRSFISAYKPRRFTIVNLEYQGKQTVAETPVYWIRPGDLPAHLQNQDTTQL